jgi:hypothetical protein
VKRDLVDIHQIISWIARLNGKTATNSFPVSFIFVDSKQSGINPAIFTTLTDEEYRNQPRLEQRDSDFFRLDVGNG